MRSDRSRTLVPVAAALAFAAAGPGCTTRGGRLLERAPLQHVVLIELSDPAGLSALQSDSDRLIPTIPGVRGYLSGTHVDVGRANVSSDYDLAIVVEFDSIDDYRRYLEDPAHLELVRTWKPKWRRATIYDFGAVGRGPAKVAASVAFRSAIGQESAPRGGGIRGGHEAGPSRGRSRPWWTRAARKGAIGQADRPPREAAVTWVWALPTPCAPRRCEKDPSTRQPARPSASTCRRAVLASSPSGVSESSADTRSKGRT